MLFQPDRTLALGNYRISGRPTTDVPASKSRNIHCVFRKRRAVQRLLRPDRWSKGAEIGTKYGGSKVVLGQRGRWVSIRYEYFLNGTDTKSL